jgi:hypothetical protein
MQIADGSNLVSLVSPMQETPSEEILALVVSRTLMA